MADFDGSLSRSDVCSFRRMLRVIMARRWLGLGIAGIVFSMVLLAQTGKEPDVQSGRGPYARIAILRALDGHTVDFEAGYMRHLEWHRQAKDPWSWYGWTIWAGDRQRWFIYATFGHSAAAFDNPVSPAEDERDNVLNVLPHAQFLGNALFEYLPALSHGTGEPQPTARVELTTVELVPGAARAFEAAVGAGQSALQGETLWYRMVAGGSAPRYVRLRPRSSVSAVLDGRNEQDLPDTVNHLIAKATIELLTLRPTMSLGLRPSP